jgi:glutamyl-Q tRNA(Asp) synthetase
LRADEPPLWQSQREHAYARAAEQLRGTGVAYPCGCSRADIAAALRAAGVPAARQATEVYPGTCRDRRQGKPAHALRLRTPDALIDWQDRRLGVQQQNVAQEVGDFVLKRADGLWAYQLAVVVDDAWQGISDVVRGEDLADNTARQIVLQRALGLPTPRYLHTPLVRAANGEKLSKQNGARALDLADPLAALRDAARVLELPAMAAAGVDDWLVQAAAAWARRWLA